MNRTFVLDPLEGKLYDPHDAKQRIGGLYSHRWTACARRGEPGPATFERLFRMLLDIAGWSVSHRKWEREFKRKYGRASRMREGFGTRERVELARKIEDLFRRGAPWPWMPGMRSDDSDGFWFTPSSCGQTRPRTERPRNDWCLRWNGLFWAPCRTVKERRESGYVPLLMCWPPPRPRPGEFIVSGERARFAYRVAEVERFDPPRGVKRWTCRLWCERVDPLLVPKSAVSHRFHWHPRPRRKAA